MKKFVFLILCVVSCILSNYSFAQSFSAGVKGGISIPNLTSGGSDNPLNTGYRSGLGPDAAIFGEYSISSLFSLEVSVEYSAQGGNRNGKQALPADPADFPPGQAPQYLWANFDAKARLNYLMVPVMGKFSFNLGSQSPFKIYIDGGPFAGLLLSAKTVSKGSSNVYADEAETTPLFPGPIAFDTTMDIKSDLHKANIGVAANIGLVYTFDDNALFIEGGGNYGFINIQKDKANGQNHTGAATVRIGYAYTFGGGGAEKAVKSPKVFH